MNQRPCEVTRWIPRLCVAVLSGHFALQSSSAFAQGDIDPDARSVLGAMSTHLGELAEFSADFDADFDVIAPDGQKLKFVSSGDFIVRRPGNLRANRAGTIADVELTLNDGTLSVYGRGLNGYIQLPAEDIDSAIDVLRDEIGFVAPGADIISATPFDLDLTDVMAGTHVGMTMIGDASVHHLAFRGERVDWQLWVTDGDKPVPLRYVITSKWLTGAPEYSVRLSNWNFAPVIGPDTFTFSPPADATRLPSVEVDAVGQLSGN